MINLILMARNAREEAILKTAFEQAGLNVLLGKPGYHNYVKILQFSPDLMVMELPIACADEMHFVELVRAHKNSRKIPILGYGERVEEGVRKGFRQRGVTVYVDRPLNFARLRAVIDVLLKPAKKTIEAKKEPTDLEKVQAAILDATTPVQQKISLIVDNVAKLLAFPFTIAKVLRLTGKDSTGATELAKAIEADPVIAAHLLKVSNSVFFASLNRRISSVKDSIVRIGFGETKRIVMSMSVMNLFDRNDKNAGFDRVGFWYHSLAAGIVAADLAKNMGGINPEEAFLAGLLHDFGVIIFDEFIPEVFSKVLEETSNRGARFADVEKAMLGFTHNDVIAELFPKWKMHDTITRGVCGQHEFHSWENMLDTEEKRIALCAGAADLIAKSLAIGRECDQFVRPVGNWVFSALKMPAGISPRFCERIQQEVSQYRQFLDLEQREWPQECKGVANAEYVRVGIVNLAKDLFVPPALYLPKQRLQVEIIPSGKPASEADLKHHVILLWTGAENVRKLADEYAKAIRYYPGGFAGTPEPVRLLIMARDQQPFADLKSASILPGAGDLREIDKAIAAGCKDIALATQERHEES